MAMVLDALASYLLKTLSEMTKEEVKILFGASSNMDKMSVKLGDLKRFIADADRRNITEETVQAWVKELKGAMYDAADIIDLCQLKAMKQGKHIDAGCFNPLLFCMRHPLFSHDIGNRMKKLNQRLDDIKERSAAFNFINLGSEEDRIRNKTSSCSSRRETSGELNELALVGEKIEEDTRYLVEKLIEEEETSGGQNKIIIFAIVGVGGIGKTTLAQSIFNNDTIKQQFTKKLWLSVNQDFDDIELLKKSITEAEGDQQEAGNTKGALERTLKLALMGHKTILVMDDVWDHKAWVDVLETPLTQALAPGSRVLITTRHNTTARGMMAEEPYHDVNKLEPADAWSLLKKQVVRNKNDESQVDMLKDIGMEIVARCDGLPLALKVMGGLLRQKRTTRIDWTKVVNNSIWSISQMPDDLNYAIYLSYQDLHPSLKSCFLHFSLLPKSILFLYYEIVGMWVGEGFVHGDASDLEELGREYYDELILRNLIEPSARYVDQSVCGMHDVVRSFAQYVARDEALAAPQGGKTNIIEKLNSQKIIRLSIETKYSESNILDWTSLQTQISLRTLISVGPIKIKAGDSLATFSILRTLYIQNGNFDALEETLVKLKHLRYLSIHNTSILRLPENIGKMKFLQYINLLGCKSLLKLPSSIRSLLHLRFLQLKETGINNVPIGFHDLTDLRKLYGFPAHMDGDRCSLEELGALSKLAHLHICGLENVSSSSFAGKVRLFEKVHLRYLELSCSNTHGDDDPLVEEDENISNQRQQQIEEVFDELCPPSSIENLSIDGYFGRQLPSWMTSTTTPPFGSLRIVMMEDLPFCTELPDGLCQLPCLELLKIKNAPAIKRVGPELSQGHHHNEHPGASLNFGSAVKVLVVECFGLERICNLPKTQELRILVCPKLKVVEGMPELQRLMLEDYDMKTLPGYLKDVNPRHLDVNCDVSLLTSMAVRKSGPEWFKFRHIKQVKAYADDDDNNIKRKWYVLYKRDPFSFKTNINRSSIAQARRKQLQRAWLLNTKTCPIEEVEWTVGRASSDKRRPLCERVRCNAYRYLILWLRRECLHCCEVRKIADSSYRWTNATAYQASRRIRLTAQQFARP